jgi:hypothetical protein
MENYRKFLNGDRVEIIGENKSKHSRIGHQGIVLRKGVQGMWWLKLDDGNELVWKGKWLQKKENENGDRIEQNKHYLSVWP